MNNFKQATVARNEISKARSVWFHAHVKGNWKLADEMTAKIDRLSSWLTANEY